MSLANYNQSVLTVLIFGPQLATGVAAFISNENLLRRWTLGFTTSAALYSLPLFWRFDVSNSGFQFTRDLRWIPALKINYAVGVDGISLLMVLLTTLIMPLCVLASWGYIKNRVKEFMICLLIMETSMVG